MANKRSSSSLGSTLLKPSTPGLSNHETPKKLSLIPDLSKPSKSKQDLEVKILDLMKEMKTFKAISTKIKKQENELKSLQETLVKSNDEIQNTRHKYEKSYSLLLKLLKGLKSQNFETLNPLFSVVSQHISKLKNKRNSLITSESENSRNSISIQTTRDQKVRSPYSSTDQFFKTPRIKKSKLLKGGRKSAKLSMKKIVNGNSKLYLLLGRVKALFEYFKKK